MYSLVLMAALSTGPATVPDCHGCHGCWGGCYGCCGCYGGCSGCYGCYGCCGCWGGYSCCGCWGGYSDCYGCWGCSGCYGCSGCSGCWGGYGYGYGGCQGWTGCYGGYPSAYYTPPAGGPPAVGAPAGGGAESAPPPGKGTGDNKKETSATRAKVIVEVPSDAKLYIDDQLMKTPSTRRVYSTPDLEPGQAYYYVVRVELVHDGQTQSETKRVILRAGQEVRADFTGMAAVAAVKAEAGLGR